MNEFPVSTTTRLRTLLVTVAWGALSIPTCGAAGSPAAEAVATIIEAERTLLNEDLVRQQRMAQERSLALRRLGDVYVALDAAIARKDSATLETMIHQVEKAERHRAEQLASERMVVERLRDRLRRISVLQERLVGLGSDDDRISGPLQGRWSVSLLPTGQRGVFNLLQTGAIVSGTYELDGGWTGSLTGTLVDRKVHFIRIDSKLGRSMELEGFLSSDGNRIRGSWQNYDLSGDVQPSGQWTAVRRRESE
jgi:hypothetical protein